jgi:integrase
MVRVSKFRRPNGYWYVRYWIGSDPVDESARTKSETEAERYRVRRDVEINAGIQPIKHSDLDSLIIRYLEALPPGTSASHRHESRRILEGFLEICGRKRRDGTYRLRSEHLSPELIDRFITRRQKTQLHSGLRIDARLRRIVRRLPITNVTLRKELRYLSGFFNWCCRQRPRYLPENPIPLSNAASIKSDAKPHFMITDEELRRLLSACRTPRQYLFLMLGWWTGGRRGEIRALHYYHFDFDARTLDMQHFKNNMFCVLPVSEEIITIVKQLYEQAQESDPLFPNDPLSHQAFAHLCREAGVRHHRFHDFRISTSMKIKSGGFDASLAALWVGNQATTNRVHYTDLTAVATRIGSLLEVPGLPPVPWQNA